MTTADYGLLALVALALFFAVRNIVRSRKSGKCVGCSGDCGCCKKR